MELITHIVQTFNWVALWPLCNLHPFQPSLDLLTLCIRTQGTGFIGNNEHTGNSTHDIMPQENQWIIFHYYGVTLLQDVPHAQEHVGKHGALQYFYD